LGKAVGLTFLMYECSTAEGNGHTFLKLRACAKHGFRDNVGPDFVKVGLSIDGDRVNQPRRWTYTSSNRVVDFAKNNIARAPGGPTKSIAHGLFYMFRPMTPGDHVITGRFAFGEGPPIIIRFRFSVEG